MTFSALAKTLEEIGSGKAKRKEHGARRKTDKIFPHEFSSTFLLLTAFCSLPTVI
jgi:hypothetical protein